MTRKSDWDCHDVEWHAPGLKRPIAYSTVATKEWIDMLAGCGLTVEQMHAASVLDDEARRVLEAYMERGLGGKTGAELCFEGDEAGGAGGAPSPRDRLVFEPSSARKALVIFGLAGIQWGLA